MLKGPWSRRRQGELFQMRGGVGEDVIFEPKASSDLSFFTLDWKPIGKWTNLDTLTGFYSSRFARLARGEQDVLYTMIAVNANLPLGSEFTPSYLLTEEAARAHGDTLGKSINYVSVVLGRLVEKNIIEKTRKGHYRLRHPAFELWARVRFFGMRQQPYAAFFQGNHPLLLQDTADAPNVFWKKLCTQAGVNGDKLPMRRRSPMSQLAA